MHALNFVHKHNRLTVCEQWEGIYGTGNTKQGVARGGQHMKGSTRLESLHRLNFRGIRVVCELRVDCSHDFLIISNSGT